LTSPDDRRKALEILDEGMANGALARELALLLGVGLTTLQRWRRQFAGDGDASTVARAATATSLTASVRRNANGS
jgi:transposase-like protein